MFQTVQVKEEHEIIYSNILLPCGYLKYHLTTEKDLNTIQFQRVKYLDIRWNPLLPLVTHHVFRIDPLKRIQR